MSLLLALALQGATAETPPAAFDVQGFRSQLVVEIDAPPARVWDAATGDVTGWWDHSFAIDPAAMAIEAEAGGRFYEYLKTGSTDGALHARVIYADAPQTLRLDGPLGLSGRAVQLVTTWSLAEAQDGAATRFTVDIAMQGELDAELAGAVHGVWTHFIGVRLKPYVEAGCDLAPDMPCAAFDD